MIKINDLQTNSIFLLSFWSVSVAFYIVLQLIPGIDIKHTSTPPDFLQWIAPVMLLIMGGYVAVFLRYIVFDLIDERKFEKDNENRINYGIISFATLGMVFIDLLSILSTGSGYLHHVYSGTDTPLWQEVFLHIFAPTVFFAIVLLTSKFMKIKYEKRSPI